MPNEKHALKGAKAALRPFAAGGDVSCLEA